MYLIYDVLTVDAGRREESRTEGVIIKEDQCPAFTSHKSLTSLLLSPLVSISLEKIILANQRPHEVDAAEPQRGSCCVLWRVLGLISHNISVVGDGQGVEKETLGVPIGVGDNKSIITNSRSMNNDIIAIFAFQSREYLAITCNSSRPWVPSAVSTEILQIFPSWSCGQLSG